MRMADSWSTAVHHPPLRPLRIRYAHLLIKNTQMRNKRVPFFMWVSYGSMWAEAYRELTSQTYFNIPWPLCSHNTEERAWSTAEYLSSAISNLPEHIRNEKERAL